MNDFILNLIGNTPLIKLKDDLYIKLERFNYTGSIKDRAALFMVTSLIEEGVIKPFSKVVIASSGNMALSLASICSIYDLKLLVVMPKNVSENRISLLKKEGIKIELFGDSIKDSISYAKSIKDYFYIDQFSLKYNYMAYYRFKDEINVDFDTIYVGIGSGGTLRGLRDIYKDKKIYGIRPTLNHQIEGLSFGFSLPFLDSIEYEEVKISNEDAKDKMNLLNQKYHLLVGLSSGAIYSAYLKLHQKNEKALLIFPDSYDRY